MSLDSHSFLRLVRRGDPRPTARLLLAGTVDAPPAQRAPRWLGFVAGLALGACVGALAARSALDRPLPAVAAIGAAVALPRAPARFARQP